MIKKTPTKKQLQYWQSMIGHANRNTGKTWFKKGKSGNPKTQFKKGHKGFWFGKSRLEMTAEKSPVWKGDGASYSAKHHWIKRKLGNPNKCEYCGTTEKRKYHWANKNHKYLRDINDWLRLCVPCHRKYDYGD